MLTAAMLDSVAAQVVRTGRVVPRSPLPGSPTSTSIPWWRYPEALDVQAPRPGAADPDEWAPPALHVVPTAVRSSRPPRTRSRRRPRPVRAPRPSLAEAEEAVEALNARRLQLQGEADELRRRLAAIEDDVDEVDEELEEAEEARDEAQVVLAEARRAQADAEQELAKLRG